MGLLLTRASGLVVRATHAALADVGLRVRQYSVLVLADDTADGISQRDLAEALGLDPSQVVALVDERAAAGVQVQVGGPTAEEQQTLRDLLGRVVAPAASARRTAGRDDARASSATRLRCLRGKRAGG